VFFVGFWLPTIAAAVSVAGLSLALGATELPWMLYDLVVSSSTMLSMHFCIWYEKVSIPDVCPGAIFLSYLTLRIVFL
jgi:hypothetical protein